MRTGRQPEANQERRNQGEWRNWWSKEADGPGQHRRPGSLRWMTEAEPGIWLTGATMEQMKETGKPEQGRSPVKPKEWRVEAQLETQKSVTEAERRPTEVCPDVRGSP